MNEDNVFAGCWPDWGSIVSQYPISGLEVLEAEQDSLYLCLLGLGLRLQDLERGLRPWTLAQSMTVRLQVGSGKLGKVCVASGEGGCSCYSLVWEVSFLHVLGLRIGNREGGRFRVWVFDVSGVCRGLMSMNISSGTTGRPAWSS